METLTHNPNITRTCRACKNNTQWHTNEHTNTLMCECGHEELLNPEKEE